MASVRALAVAFACIAWLPLEAYAQATISGVVRDGSGAVLPGVTVEASSPVLIEKTRTAVTDGTGQYRIVDLPAGAYSVTFVLAGFNSQSRADIQLTGSFTAAVDAELSVGTLQESVTVTGESPIVDVQGSKVQKTLDSSTIAQVPNARQYYSFTALVPGLNIQGSDVGGSSGPTFSVFQAHGGRRNEGRLQVDGAEVGFLGVSYYVADIGAAQEVAVTVTGGLGEAATGGPVMNVMSRSGGNTFSGSLFANFANGAMTSNNITDTLRAAGLVVPNSLEKNWDSSASIGGPIRRDRIWFFANARHQGSRNLIAGVWRNLNAGDPNKWTYQPDLSQQAQSDGTWKNAGLRLTWQATPRNRFVAWLDEQSACRLCLPLAATTTTAPEATNQAGAYPERAARISWTSPLTNRVLLEANVRQHVEQFGGIENGNTRSLTRVTEQAGLIPGLTYRSQNWTRPFVRTVAPMASLSYITGAHNVKTGFIYTAYSRRAQNYTNDNLLAYRFRDGVPNQLTMTAAADLVTLSEIRTQAAYVQDQSTFGRVTFQGGLRYEHVSSYFPEQRLGPSRFVPTPIMFASQDSPIGLHDLFPRGGMSLDVFGNRKTALKITFGRYPPDVAGTTGVDIAANPASNVATSTNRAWTDANGNFLPDCELLNPVAQDLRSSGGDVCGAWATQGFGRNVVTTSYDPSVTTGFNRRPYSWDLTTTIQHELVSRMSVEVSYARRIYGNFIVTDNRAVTPADYDPFSVAVPVDSRLPGGGGGVITGLYDVKPTKFGLVDNLVTSASNFGKQIEHYNGVDVSVNVRGRRGLTLQGGLSTGRIVTDECDVLPKLDSPSPLYCHNQTPFLTSYSGLVGYTIPRIDLQIGATMQSRPFQGANAPTITSQSLTASYVVPNALVVPSLGRNLAGNAANVTVNVVQPGTLYGDRINQIDFRANRRIGLGSRRVMLGVDVYNILNSSAVTTYNQTYGQAWLTPQAILTARFAKVTAQIDF
jgi:hypothetical protein